MAEWRDAQLGELIDIKHGFAFKGEFFSDEPTGEILVTPGNFAIGGGFQLNKPKFYSGPVPTEYVLNPGDVIVTMTDLSKQADTLGYSAVVPAIKPRLLHNQRIGKVIAKDASANLDFIAWLMRTRAYRQEIVGGATGSTVKHTSPGRILAHRFKLPSRKEQQDIVGVLKPLDDKIEVNRRINETLEGMAQAIFRDWFVDFGPTRRKAAGEVDPVAIMGGLIPDPARAAELADIFPAALGGDELPLGWAQTPLGDLVKIQGGSTPSTADESLWSPGIHHWATPKDLSSMDNLALFGTSRQISDAGLAKITSGLLPAGSVLLSSRAPIGYLAIAQVPVAINQGFIGLLPTAEIGSAYLYFWCKANMDKITANANGSTFQEISKRNFRPITSAVPDNLNIVAKFDKIITPLIDRIVTAAKENQTLAETRDYLLPRLMSGEVRIAPSDEERV